MTHLAGTTLLGLVGEDGDLLALTVLNYGSLNGRILNVGLSNLEGGGLFNSNDLVKNDLGVLFSVELFYIDEVALFYAILLSACFDNSVHFFGTCLNISLATEGVPKRQL